MADITLKTGQQLAAFYREGGNFCEVYLDMSVDTADPPGVRDERRMSVLDTLRKSGAPQTDLDAVADALATGIPGPSPVSLYVLVKDGAIRCQEVLSGRVVGPERVAYGPLPDVSPLLRTHVLDFAYLVVETARDGGEARLFRAASPAVEAEEQVQGRTDTLHKVKRGGDWRNNHFQNHAMEIWKQTQSQLASTIDEVVRQHSPRFIVVAGDIRARQLLVEELSPASRDLVAIEPTNTRAEGSKDDALLERLDAEIARVLAAGKEAILDKLNMHDGRGDKLGELNLGGVVRALASAQVETLVLDSGKLQDHTLLAVDGEPWIAAAPEDTLGAPVIATVSAQLAMIRAALLTDAEVVFTDSFTSEEGEDSITLPQHAAAAAVLRWASGPPVPGV
ncbi:MAG TPA: Vms1/Ankzf1 family peptidyl-tRNA hydrolase [Glaciihabitans sp.]|jgi:hypothetical protein|nr:Vms1/Ankzf1 family peptidyl-tRNA hydrolase [Glaciihabitans sp.]